MIGSWPRSRSAAAVRSASAAGRVSSRRTVSLHKEAGTGAALELTAGIGAKRRRFGAVALARDLERRAAVGLGDQAMKINGIAVDAGVAGDRRAAGAIEHGEENALGGQRGRGVGIADRGDQRAGPRIVSPRFEADRALADRRQELIDIQHLRWPPPGGRAA